MPTLSAYYLNNKPETWSYVEQTQADGRGRRQEGRLGNGGGEGSWIRSLTPITPKLMSYTHGFKWQKSRPNQSGVEKKLLAAVVIP